VQVVIAASKKALKPTSKLIKAVKAAAADLRGQALFVVCDTATGPCQEMVQYFGLSSTTKEPQASLMRHRQTQS
jgi:hypothetical protein